MKERILDKKYKTISISSIKLHRISDTEFESDVINDTSFGEFVYTEHTVSDRPECESYQERACWYMDFYPTRTEIIPKHLRDGNRDDMETFCRRLRFRYDDVNITGILESLHPLRFRIRVTANMPMTDEKVVLNKEQQAELDMPNNALDTESEAMSEKKSNSNSKSGPGCMNVLAAIIVFTASMILL